MTRRKKKRKKRPDAKGMLGKPGRFYYASGMVFEADKTGTLRPRPELGPNNKFTHKYYR